VWGAGNGVQGAPLKERFALGALRLRSVPSELAVFLLQAQRSASETLIKRSTHSARAFCVAGYGEWHTAQGLLG